MREDISNYEKYRPKINFIKKYELAVNAASGSQVDPNANVEQKNIATMSGEAMKPEYIGINRLLMIDKLNELYGKPWGQNYIDDLKSHIIYKHDETQLFPYTYGGQEVVNVKYNEKNYCVSFSQLYDICNEKEIFTDDKNNVWIKYPKNMMIEDKNKFVKIDRLIKKQRHRDLYRIKLAFSNDLIVTDNHPLIIDDNKNTISAIDSIGNKQFRCASKMYFGGQEEIKTNDISTQCCKKEELKDCYIFQNNKNCTRCAVPKTIKLDEELGYAVGFFIGDGFYVESDKSINYCQNDKETLQKISNILYKKFGTPSTIYKKESEYILKITNIVLFSLFKNTFNIKSYSQNKTLPQNIYDYNKSFSIGVIEGLIDSDGTVEKNGNFLIRMSSRTAILQITNIINSLGITTGNTTQETPFGQNKKILQKYKLFGVKFRPQDNGIFKNSYKNNKIKILSKGIKSCFEDWQTISNVTKISNEPFLNLNNFIYDITTETGSFVCNGIWVHNCTAVTLYPFLFGGTNSLGGASSAPQHLSSFCGSFVNLVYTIAAQFAGAVATPEFLMYMDYFIRKDYSEDYPKHIEDAVTTPFINHQETLENIIDDCFSQVVYSLNEPSATRGMQAVFWNIAYFDRPYFEGMFKDFVFPDGSEPKFETLDWLQKHFMKWFNNERTKKLLTFPVETMNLLNDGEKYVDNDYFDWTCQMYSEGHSFFVYTSDSVDSLASCCRVKNEIESNVFSYTLGAGGLQTGSKSVMTININRLVQDATKAKKDISEAVKEIEERVHKYQLAYNAIQKDYYDNNMLPVFKAGYNDLTKCFLTTGLNGIVEGAEFLGISPTPNEKYFKYVESILKPIWDMNKRDRTKEVKWNTEMVPAENLGVKNAKWDKKDGYAVPRDCYNSYFYLSEDENIHVPEKFILQGRETTKYLDGGVANHVNLKEHLTKEQYEKVLNYAIKTGCTYYTFNIPNTVCNKCGKISKHFDKKCRWCGSEDLDYGTRIIGYIKRISRFSLERQKEASKRYYE
jgi:anaerobic ribonucleoside-triphosphate reductase